MPPEDVPYGNAYSSLRQNLSVLCRHSHGCTNCKSVLYRLPWWSVQSMAMRKNIFLFTVSNSMWKSIGDNKTWSNIFLKKISLNFLSPTQFHMVLLTFVEKRLMLYLIGTDTTVPMVNNACKEYHTGRIVHGDETKILIVHCKHFYMKIDQWQNIRSELFLKNSAQMFCPGLTCVWQWLQLFTA